ncbi:hypothetical protein IFM89_031548 [Coptis chinensis]|uniref:Uncharacterized protein n=1 Tax=Coptis chinensis TaxID=261450 RepID=A0A835IGP9_9MAGN|nr:hypothetical protein IFM89_031548 [Coptis chinensis]
MTVAKGVGAYIWRPRPHPAWTCAWNNNMSGYENVVGGKLKLKGKALNVKAGGLEKKKKHKKHYDRTSALKEIDLSTDDHKKSTALQLTFTLPCSGGDSFPDLL